MKAGMRPKLFAEAYVSLKGNGTEAARRAGYKGSDKALAVQAVRLLGTAKVQALIAAGTEKALASVRGGVSPQEVVEELGSQMRGEKPARWRDQDKLYDSQGAAALLGKFLGLEKPKESSPAVIVALRQEFGQLNAQDVETIRAYALKGMQPTGTEALVPPIVETSATVRD